MAEPDAGAVTLELLTELDARRADVLVRFNIEELADELCSYISVRADKDEVYLTRRTLDCIRCRGGPKYLQDPIRHGMNDPMQDQHPHRKPHFRWLLMKSCQPWHIFERVYRSVAQPREQMNVSSNAR